MLDNMNKTKRGEYAKSVFTKMKLLVLLRGYKYMDLEEIAKLIKKSERQTQRYIDDIIDGGIIEIKKSKKSYRIPDENFANQPIFGSDELDYLLGKDFYNKLNNKELYNKIIKSISLNLPEYKTEEEISNKTFANIIKVVETALKEKKKVIIPEYHSRDKGITYDRHITIIELDKVNRRIYALQDGVGKVFNIENIKKPLNISKKEEAEVNVNNWAPKENKDVFGFTPNYNAKAKILVVIDLNSFAYSMLIRQFPIMDTYIAEIIDPEFKYQLKIGVWDIQPIARYASGLLHCIRVIKGKDEIRDYFTKNILRSFNNNF